MSEAAPSVVHLIDPSGEVVPVPADQAIAARSLGYAPASPEQIDAFQKAQAIHEKYGTPAQMAATFGEHALSAATLGASDWLERGLGISTPEAMAAREAENPIASGLGTATGIIAPLIATAGGAGAAEGAGALRGAAELTAPSVISRAGRAVQGVVEGALPARLAGSAAAAIGPAGGSIAARLASRAAVLGAGSAIEGAAYGLGQDVHEAALGDHNLTAQSVIAHMGLGAALGGVFGAATGAAEVGIPALVQKGKQAAANLFGKVEGGIKSVFTTPAAEAVTGTPPDVAQVLFDHKLELTGLDGTIKEVGGAKAGSLFDDLAGAKPQMVKFVAENAPRFEAAERQFPGITRSLAQTSPETARGILDGLPGVITDPAEQVRIASTVRKNGQDFIESVEAAFKKANGQMMKEGAGALLQDADPEAVFTVYSNVLDEMKASVAKMEAEPSMYRPVYKSTLEKIMKDVGANADAATDPVQAFKHLKDLRRLIGDNVDWSKRGLLDLDVRNAQDEFRRIYSTLRESLQDEAVFGTAGARQAELDAAQHDWLGVIRRRPGAMLGHSEKGTSNFNFLLMKGGELDASKLRQMFNHIQDDTGAAKLQAWGEMMDAGNKALNAVQKLHEAAPVTDFDRAAADALASKTAQSTAEARARFAVTNQIRDLQRAKQGFGSVAAAAENPAQEMAMKALEFSMPGAVTSTIKGTISFMRNATSVPKQVQTLSALERMGQSVSNKIDATVSTLVRAGVRASNIGRGEVVAGLEHAFDASPASAQSTFTSRVKEIQKLAQNPQHMQDTLTAQTDGWHEHAPNTAEALNVASARAVSFLQSKIPQVPKAGILAAESKPSQADIAKFNRYYEAVNHPLSIVKHAAAGTLTPEEVEAVQQVYPQLHQQIVQKLLMRASTAKDIPYRNRLMIALLAGRDVDGSLKPESVVLNQHAFQNPASQQAQGPGQPRGSKAGAGKITKGKMAATGPQALAMTEEE